MNRGDVTYDLDIRFADKDRQSVTFQGVHLEINDERFLVVKAPDGRIFYYPFGRIFRFAIRESSSSRNPVAPFKDNDFRGLAATERKFLKDPFLVEDFDPDQRIGDWTPYERQPNFTDEFDPDRRIGTR